MSARKRPGIKDVARAAGRAGMAGILASDKPRPTAVFCANDLLAIGAITMLQEAGLSIPGDMSVVGFDDIPLAAQMTVPLTTVRQPTGELGWQAADLLLRTTDGLDHRISVIPDLVVRNSTGPAPGQDS